MGCGFEPRVLRYRQNTLKNAVFLRVFSFGTPVCATSVPKGEFLPNRIAGDVPQLNVESVTKLLNVGTPDATSSQLQLVHLAK